jgi:hypothetical protein
MGSYATQFIITVNLYIRHSYRFHNLMSLRGCLINTCLFQIDGRGIRIFDGQISSAFIEGIPNFTCINEILEEK